MAKILRLTKITEILSSFSDSAAPSLTGPTAEPTQMSTDVLGEVGGDVITTMQTHNTCLSSVLSSSPVVSSEKEVSRGKVAGTKDSLPSLLERKSLFRRAVGLSTSSTLDTTRIAKLPAKVPSKGGDKTVVDFLIDSNSVLGNKRLNAESDLSTDPTPLKRALINTSLPTIQSVVSVSKGP